MTITQIVTDGLPADLAARMRAVDAKRVAAGLVLIISKDGEFISRLPCRDEEQKSYKIRQAELMGRDWEVQKPE